MSILIDLLDADLCRAVENVREAVTHIWARPLHRYYTDHTVAHSERIIALLDGLTVGMMATSKRLSSTEVFVLLAATYLHDIGMQNEKFAGGDLDKIRAAHNERTAEMIYAVFEHPADAFAIPLVRDPGIVESVALVAKGHRQVDLNTAEYESFVHSGEMVRLQLLAALLRFGDELDIDHRRVDLEQMKLLKLPVESQLHWWKCHYVSGVSVVDEYIRIGYRFPQGRSDYQDLIVPLVEREIRAKHAALEEIFRANSVKVALGQFQVRLMRLVQPLPTEVESLAREQVTKDTASPAASSRSEPSVPSPQGSDVSVIASGERSVAVGGDVRDSIVIVGDGNVIGNRSSSHVVKARPPTAGGKRESPGGEFAGRVWNMAAIRDLLTAALTDQELTAMCFDHFRRVYEEFAVGMSKGQKVQQIVEYCDRQDRIDELLALVRERNPAQYRRFEKQLRE